MVMFARVKESRNGEYLQIVENYRDSGRVRQRMVLYVGHYRSIADTLRRMPWDLRFWRRRRMRIGNNELRPKEAEHLGRLIETTDERLKALRALVEEHPDLVARDEERAVRHARRQRERMRLGGKRS
jgi:hypothetical protein